MGDEPAVRARGVVKRYGDLVAVNGLDLTVERGEVYGVLGPNGAGKTTFLRMLFGLIAADEGEIRLHGRALDEHGMRALDGVAGFIESPKFYPYLSGRRNLELLAAFDGGVDAALIDESLEVVDLADRAADRVGGYSFGMRQRLGVAAALIRRPTLLVLDEPANGLDPAGIRDMRALVRRLADQGLTVLLSSHNMLEVEEICDNVTIMHKGNVAFHGSIADLRGLAPDPAYQLTTSDDDAALAICRTAAGVTAPQLEEGMIRFHATRAVADALMIELAGRGIAVRSLQVPEAPLETLFFLLTEQAGRDAAAAGDGAGLDTPVREVVA